MIIENCTFEQNAGITSGNDIPYIPRHLIEKLLYHITVNQSYLSTAVLKTTIIMIIILYQSLYEE